MATIKAKSPVMEADENLMASMERFNAYESGYRAQIRSIRVSRDVFGGVRVSARGTFSVTEQDELANHTDERRAERYEAMRIARENHRDSK